MLTALLFLFYASMAFGEGDTAYTEMSKALDNVHKGCEKELTTHCKEVLPGHGRLIICLKKVKNELSPQCEIVFHDTVEKLKVIIPTLANANVVCKKDIQTHCDGINLRGNRIFDALKKIKPR